MGLERGMSLFFPPNLFSFLYRTKRRNLETDETLVVHLPFNVLISSEWNRRLREILTKRWTGERVIITLWKGFCAWCYLIIKLAVVELYVIYCYVSIVVPSSDPTDHNSNCLIGRLRIVDTHHAMLPLVTTVTPLIPQVDLFVIYGKKCFQLFCHSRDSNHHLTL